MNSNETTSLIIKELEKRYSAFNLVDVMAVLLFSEKIYRKYYSEDTEKIKYNERFLNKSIDRLNKKERQIYKKIQKLNLIDEDHKISTMLQQMFKNDETEELYKVLEKLLKNEENNTTDTSISNLSLKILDIKENDRIIDLCSGYGLFLMEAFKNKRNIEATGIEINSLVSNTSRILHYLIGRKSKIINNDVLRYEVKVKYDKIFSEFPFMMKLNKDITLSYQVILVIAFSH
jgi:16S rRNA C967 or C1407 C5-methylase (RsmB/RsmF family)